MNPFDVLHKSDLFSSRLQPEWSWSEVKPTVFTCTADCVRYFVVPRYHSQNKQNIWVCFAVPSSHPWTYHGFLNPNSHDYLENQPSTIHELVHHGLFSGCLPHIARGFEPYTTGATGPESIVLHSLHPIAAGNELLDLLGQVELRHLLIEKLKTDLTLYDDSTSLMQLVPSL